MKRIAIIGGGISGVSAAYFCAKAGAQTTLFEATGRLGGTLCTQRVANFIVELGPDGWVSEKPWARELAVELGLASELVHSNDARRRTLLLREGKLTALPEGMRMMVPLNEQSIRESDLLSEQAKSEYLSEPSRAAELKKLAQATDDISVADFVRRHFGEEATRAIAGPLLAGVFGGDIERLSARSVMPMLVALAREHGSLTLALRQRTDTRTHEQPAGIFTALRRGNAAMVRGASERLAPGSIRLHTSVQSIARAGDKWTVTSSGGADAFHAVMLATPAHVTRALLSRVDERLSMLHDMPASSGLIAALLFDGPLELPQGFGFLVQQPQSGFHSALLAATFSKQKFPHSVPAQGDMLRVFFGGPNAGIVDVLTDAQIASLARTEMKKLFPRLPQASRFFVRRCPRSLPQYEIGHEARVRDIEQRVGEFPGLFLLGNAYRGVGLPDLIRLAKERAEAAANMMSVSS